MKNKILYVDNRSQYFVANRLPLAIAVRDRLAEVHITTLSRRDQDIEIMLSNGLSFHKLYYNSSGQSISKPLLMSFELAYLFNKLSPNLIHFFTFKAICSGIIASLFVRKTMTAMTITGLGYTFTSSGLKPLVLRAAFGAVLAPLLRKTRGHFIFQNPDNLAFFHNNFRLPLERSYLVKGSGVDIYQYKILPEIKSTPTIVCISRMLREKGMFEFVEAAKQIKNAGTQARFLLVGDTDPENPSGIPASQLMEWHKSGWVEWLGYSQDIPNLLSQAHIVCLPTYGEGLPKVLLEGAACGRPIVTTDVPGCREVVRHEENGLLVPPGDSNALAAALLRLIRNPKLRESMGRKGRTLVEHEFSLEKVIQDTLTIYEKVLNLSCVK